MKLCKDCKFYRGHTSINHYRVTRRHECHRSAVVVVDPVDGHTSRKGVKDCRGERLNRPASLQCHCGPEGRYFQPEEETK